MALLAMPPWLISAILHLVMLLILGLLTLTEEDKVSLLLVVEMVVDVDEEFVEPAEISIEPVIGPTLLREARAFDVGGQAIDESHMPLSEELDLFEAMAGAEAATDDILALSQGDGMTGLDESIGCESASFFGATAEGRKFVFVVDNSNSMGRGRFETVLNELSTTIDSLSPSQQFYVIFFSDAAYRMFHPKPTEDYVSATTENKERLRAWLYTVEMCLETRGYEALQIALDMNPDAIYVLGDGGFTDGTASMMTAPHDRRIPVHTIGMEVNWHGALQLYEIAKANNGTYRDVRADTQFRLQAEQNPIKRNWSQGEIWGINLRTMRPPRRGRRH